MMRKNAYWARVMAMVLAVVLVFPHSLTAMAAENGGGGASGETGALNSTGAFDWTAINPPRIIDGVSTWDCIWFGNYWQEDTSGDGRCFSYDRNEKYPGDEKQPIKWRVLDIDSNGNALLLSDKLIDIAKYNESNVDTTWETCTLRSYLNCYDQNSNALLKDYSSTGLLNNAFSPEERNVINITNVMNADNPKFNTEGGNNTSDKLFCLSIDEVRNQHYGFIKNDFVESTSETEYCSENDLSRKCFTTHFSARKNISTGGDYSSYCGLWWLRSPGENSNRAAYVDDSGVINASHKYDYSSMIRIRPALRMNLSSSSDYWRYAGTVSSDRTVKEAVLGVSLIKERVIKEGQDTCLNPVILPANAFDKGVIWETTNDKVASVDENGKVSGIKEGSATITVKTNDGGYTDTCDITVLSKNEIAVPVTANDVSTWDCIYFGHYWQNSDTNGDGKVTQDDDKDLIKWRVLDIDKEGNALLLSDKILDTILFYSAESEVTWENCRQRSFLNSYDSSNSVLGLDYSETGFMNNAFSSSEIDLIMNNTIVNSGNTIFGLTEGNDTIDKVFFLSVSEALNPYYGFCNNAFIEPSTGKKYITDNDLTRVSNISKYVYYDNAGSPAHWWLRTRGYHPFAFSYVGHDGKVNASGYSVDKEWVGIRPAIRMNLSSPSTLWKYAGTVSSDGTVKEAVWDVSLPSGRTIKKGFTTTLVPYITPSNANNKTVEWQSSDNGVATVDEDGVVTAVDEGTADITVVTLDGEKTDTCRIKVIPSNVITAPYTVDGISTWDCIWFGNYWQGDTNGDGYCFSEDTIVTKDGYDYKNQEGKVIGNFSYEGIFPDEGVSFDADEKQPVKWRVLDMDDEGNALLLSDKLIDIARYNEASEKITWEECTLRSYLNCYGETKNKKGEDYTESGFLVNAFTEAERDAIIESEIKNENNLVWPEITGGNTTHDKLFCLSLTEARDSGYGFVANEFKYFGDPLYYTDYDKTREAVTSNFTAHKPGYGASDVGNPGRWWLRSPGKFRTVASHVDSAGGVSAEGGIVDSGDCVRPAFRMNLLSSSSIWHKAGTVLSEGNGLEYALGIILSSNVQLTVGDSTILDYELYPVSATERPVWKSDDVTIAVVDKNGKVTGVKEGETIITATTPGNGNTATCKLTVNKKPVKSVSFPEDQKTLNLKENETFTLTPVIEPDDATYKGVSFTSTDENIAKVDSHGIVTGLTPGTVIITVKSKDNDTLEAQCTVNVRRAVTGVSLPKSETIHIGESITLSPEISPENATDRTVSWGSSDNDIATVDENGTVTGLKEGNAFISATSNSDGVTVSCNVLVQKIPVEKVSLSSNQVTLNLKEDETFMLTPQITPDNATYKGLSYSSSDPEVAKVEKTTDGKGKVTGLKPGTAIITITSDDNNEIEAKCTVNVRRVVTGVSLPAREIVNVGKNKTLVLEIVPENASIQNATWESTDDGVATVDEDGVVTGVKVGNTTIKVTVTTMDGSHTATCEVTVVDVPWNIEKDTVEKDTVSTIPYNVMNAESGIVKIFNDESEYYFMADGSRVFYSLMDTQTFNLVFDDTGRIYINEHNGYFDVKSVSCVVSDNSYDFEFYNESEEMIQYERGNGTIKECGGSTPYGCFIINLSAKEIIASCYRGSVSVSDVSLPKNKTVIVGESITLEPEINPYIASDKRITWKSSDNSIASVDSKGIVTGRKEGNTYISATASNGVTASCNVLVQIIPVTGLSLPDDQYSVSIKVEESFTLTPVIEPYNATYKDVSFSISSASSSPAPIMVEKTSDGKGKITGLKPGTATVTVRTEDGRFAAKCYVTVLRGSWSIEPGVVEKNTVSTGRYNVTRVDDGVVKIFNSGSAYYFSADESRVFYSLMDTQTFNLVYDDTGRIYINEHNGSFVVRSVTCDVNGSSYYFRYYDKSGNWIQEEHTNGCGGTTPYGCYLYDLSSDRLMASCYHGGSAWNTTDTVDYYEIYADDGILEFDTSRGPYFKIDYRNKKLISSTTLVGTAQLLDCYTSNGKLVVTVTSGEYPGEHTYSFNMSSSTYYEDPLDYYEVDSEKGTIEFDTYYGPYFKIDYKNKKILECTSDNPGVISCAVSGKVLTLIVTSDEFPGEHTYSFNLDKDTFLEDRISRYEIDHEKGTVEFDTDYGPLFVIDYINKRILSCTSNNARLINCEVSGIILTLTVSSDEYPGEHAYSFNINSEQYYEDRVEYSEIDSTNGTIEFDTDRGPLFRIDFINKTILMCTSTNAKLLSCYIAGNKLNLTVTSDEFPGKHTYTFDLGTDVYNNDPIDYYEIDADKGILEFDTQCGPCFRIDYKNKILISSTTVRGTAELIDCSLVGNRLTVVVTSGEYPGEHVYSFNINKDTYFEDRVDYYEIDSTKGILEFDTEYGPMFRIDYNKKQILECSSEDARLYSCYFAGNKLTVIVSSEEYPGEHTYSFETEAGVYREDVINYYEIDENKGILEFDTQNGPYFKIDYRNKRLLESTTLEGTATLIDCNVTGNKLTVTVTSGEYPGEHTYSFILNSSSYYNDVIDHYDIDTENNTIVFDTDYGPEFTIDYGNKKIVSCTSDNAVLIKCYMAGSKLTITVTSDEFPGEHTYVFDTNVKQYINDELDYYDIDTDNSMLTFDTSKGPEFVIDYNNKAIIGCSSGGAKLLGCFKQGNNLIVTVTSNELPGDHTYIFNMVAEEFRREVVRSYNIDEEQGILDFYTDKGSHFRIDYQNKILVESSRKNARLLNCFMPGQVIAVTVANDELSAVSTYRFSLKGHDITEDEGFQFVLLQGDEYLYTGKPITPPVAITYNGMGMTEGTDYTLKYSNNVNAGSGKVTVTIKGNLTGSTSREFTINQKDISDDDVVIANLIGIGKLPRPAIYYRGQKLSAKDYSVIWDKGVMTIDGKRNFTGNVQPDVTILDAGSKLNKIKAVVTSGQKTYNGAAQPLGDNELKVTDTNGKILNAGTDYQVSYSDNVNAGTVKVVIAGIGENTGIVSKRYKILPYRAGAREVAVTLSGNVVSNGMTYTGRNITLGRNLSVKIGGVSLTEGVDYKVKYKNNKNVSDRAEYTVVFQGNYKGTANVSGTFSIVRLSLENARVCAPNKVFKKPGAYSSVPYVDNDGLLIAKGEYSVKYYSDEACTLEITKNSPMNAPGTVYVKVTGNGKNCIGFATGEFEVSSLDNGVADLSKAKVTVDKQMYSSDPLTPQVKVECKVNGVLKELTPGTDYTVEYVNNLNKGKATVIVNGTGGYVGSRVSGFVINALKVE